ncbi:ATP-binding cassette domain-containing protein [Streptomyces sp. M19]
MPRDALLAVDGLTVRRSAADGAVLLPPTGLRVAEGEVVAVTGPSGAGKSTLLHALLDVLPPGLTRTGGAVRWRARPWRPAAPPAAGGAPAAAGSARTPAPPSTPLARRPPGRRGTDGGRPRGPRRRVRETLARLGLPPSSPPGAPPNSPAARPNASPSPARCAATPNSSSWTSRPPPWTRRPPPWSRTRYAPDAAPGARRRPGDHDHGLAAEVADVVLRVGTGAEPPTARARRRARTRRLRLRA